MPLAWVLWCVAPIVAHAQALGSRASGGDPQQGDVPPLVMPEPPRPLGVAFPIRFRVAHDAAGRPVRDKEWLRAQLERANGVFAPAGVSFAAIGFEAIDAQVLESREDRHALGRRLERGVVNVFVVSAMRDVDDPREWRRGVHWRLPWRRDRHFIVVTAIAPPTTLAHELGHFFGNPQHRWVPGNVMSYEHGETPAFDPDQLHRVVSLARRYLRAKELVTLERFDELHERGVLPLYYRDPFPRELGEPRGARVAREDRRRDVGPRELEPRAARVTRAEGRGGVGPREVGEPRAARIARAERREGAGPRDPSPPPPRRRARSMDAGTR